MESFDKGFTKEQVKTWLERNNFTQATVERVSGDFLDGDDMVYMYADDKECRFYFPEFKERTKFKRLVKAEAEENQVSPEVRPVAKSSPSSVVSSDVSAEVSSLEDLDEEGEVIEKDVSFEELEESSFQEKEPKETPTSSKKVGVKRRRSERRKRQKAIKKKAKLMARTNQLIEMTDTINDLKAKCSASQNSLNSTNKAVGILKQI